MQFGGVKQIIPLAFGLRSTLVLPSTLPEAEEDSLRKELGIWDTAGNLLYLCMNNLNIRLQDPDPKVKSTSKGLDCLSRLPYSEIARQIVSRVAYNGESYDEPNRFKDRINELSLLDNSLTYDFSSEFAEQLVLQDFIPHSIDLLRTCIDDQPEKLKGYCLMALRCWQRVFSRCPSVETKELVLKAGFGKRLVFLLERFSLIIEDDPGTRFLDSCTSICRGMYHSIASHSLRYSAGNRKRPLVSQRPTVKTRFCTPDCHSPASHVRTLGSPKRSGYLEEDSRQHWRKQFITRI